MLTYALNVVAEPCFTADLAMINATDDTSGPLPLPDHLGYPPDLTVSFGGSRVTASTVTAVKPDPTAVRCAASTI